MIEINNLTTAPIDEKFLERICQKVLEEENRKKADLSIALVGPGRIKNLNRKYRKKNRVTDVLSFPEDKTLLKKFKDFPSQATQNLGEIVICLREVKKNAKIFREDFKTELMKVLIHGILHLLGYNHEKSKTAAKKMEEKENYYLKIWQKLI